ncbi:MAG TPA: flagellar hook-associated protein FlgL [Oligoflexia bacterium]|nr:flagellar hook-associated protein FlgL [Oligoflexia bacterium]
MVYRIADTQVTSSFIGQMMETKIALENKRKEISTGYKVIDASDDPGRAGTLSALQHTIQRIDRHSQRITFATTLLSTQENLVSNANDILIRAKELAVQAANGTLSTEARAQIGDEIFELRDTLAGLANTKHQGMYLYGGLDDDDPPFDLNQTAPFFYTNPPDAAPAPNPAEKTHWVFDDPAVELGQTDTRSVAISDTESVRIISRGDEVFQGAINALEILGRSLKGYRTGVDVNGDPDGTGDAYTFPDEYALQTSDIQAAIDSLESVRTDDIQAELSSIGSRVNRLEQTQQILEKLKIGTEDARSAIQDTDLFAAASEFSNLQTSLQALLAAGTRINSLTLLDYL